ncbi:MAG: primosomal protein N' family DNA-binding protein, partial [Chloroflexota bacterium]
MAYVEVVVDTTIRRGSQTYTYEVPEGLEVEPGQRVVVPFGRQQLGGVVFRLTEGRPVRDTRQLLRAAEPVLRPHQIELASWIAQHYAAPIKDAVALFLPPPAPAPRLRRLAALAPGVDVEQARAELTRAPRQRETLEALLLAPQGLDARALPSEQGLRQLVARGMAHVRTEVDEAPPLTPEVAPIVPLRRTPEQR